MPTSPPKAKTVDHYIAALAEPARSTLQKVRAAILAAAPDAVEVISYGMPVFKHGPGHGLVSVAAFKNHCSFFVMSTSVLDAFAKELGEMRTSTGTVQFPHDQPPPATLIKKLVKARLAQEAERAAEHAAKKRPVKPRATKASASDLPKLAAPARRALEAAGLTSLAKLSKKGETYVADLHGMGPNALATLKQALKASGRRFA
jgi:uncharacterized protein YdhG (YjbR/CyaY superfamily)